MDIGLFHSFTIDFELEAMISRIFFVTYSITNQKRIKFSLKNLFLFLFFMQMQQCDGRVSEGNEWSKSKTNKHVDGFVRANTWRFWMACTRHNRFKNRLDPILSAVELLPGLPWPSSSHGLSPSHWLLPTHHPLSRQHSRLVIRIFTKKCQLSILFWFSLFISLISNLILFTYDTQIYIIDISENIRHKDNW